MQSFGSYIVFSVSCGGSGLPQTFCILFISWTWLCSACGVIGNGVWRMHREAARVMVHKALSALYASLLYCLPIGEKLFPGGSDSLFSQECCGLIWLLRWLFFLGKRRGLGEPDFSPHRLDHGVVLYIWL
ncbi:hypothetical protein F4802DRAFT_540115 [Xylaria palmicola]|nr:hypothetical protein F4802DRAFT_540115 [Xylaria palmicola]